jgi:hypothetical protein
MTEAACNLLGAFEALAPADRRELLAEMLRRAATDGDDLEHDLLLTADEVFHGYDAEEAGRDGT